MSIIGQELKQYLLEETVDLIEELSKDLENDTEKLNQFHVILMQVREAFLNKNVTWFNDGKQNGITTGYLEGYDKGYDDGHNRGFVTGSTVELKKVNDK